MSHSHKFDKMSIASEKDTAIWTGQTKMTIQQMEDEISADSEIGRKLKSVEKDLKKYL